MSKFQVYKDAAGKFRFRLRAGNNQIVAVGEAYEQHASCINGIKSIQKNCNSEIEDLTINDRKVPNPKYQIYKDAADKFRFRLKAANGEIIAEGEGYESKEGCLNGIKVVRSSCDAEIEDLSIPKETTQENVVPPKMEETGSPTVEPEATLGSETAKEVEVAATPKIETPMAPSTAETTKTETVLPEAKTEEMPQPTPIPTVETKVPKTNYPTETKLELFTVTEKMNKGDTVTLKGKLSESDSGKGISGARIRIHERDTSILGDAYLAQGVTGEHGYFNIVWKAKPLTWRKNIGNIYATFYGNEIGKSSKSSIQPVIIN
ncbi:MAG: DUF1508 domain-containing protein [Candidatus Bathyarchaeia archaeon]|jgi:hypothetical protein